MRRGIVISLAAVLLAAGCQKEKPLTRNLAVENKVAVRPFVVYYEGPSLLLVAEARSAALPENPGGALSVVMRELMKGSANPSLPPLFPADTAVRAAFLLPDGTAFVDLGGLTLANGWETGSHRELMAVYSVVQTITANFPAAKRVRILVNDEPAETLAGHISLAQALTPLPSLVSTAAPIPAPPAPSATTATTSTTATTTAAPATMTTPGARPSSGKAPAPAAGAPSRGPAPATATSPAPPPAPTSTTPSGR